VNNKITHTWTDGPTCTAIFSGSIFYYPKHATCFDIHRKSS